MQKTIARKLNYFKAAVSDYKRVLKKYWWKTQDFLEEHWSWLVYLLAFFIALTVILASKVFATSQVTEIGIPRPPKIAEYKPIKKPKTQKIELAAAIEPKQPSKPLPGPVSGDVWYKLRLCESGNDYRKNTGNGYYGAYQFSASTWTSMGTGYEYAHQAPPSIQDDAAKRLQQQSGWGQWPACSKKLGLS